MFYDMSIDPSEGEFRCHHCGQEFDAGLAVDLVMDNGGVIECEGCGTEWDISVSLTMRGASPEEDGE